MGITLLSGCNTGIETTKTITLSKNDKKALSATPEDLVLSEVVPPSLSDWKPGIPFLISDNRAAVIFEFPGNLYSGSSEHLEGKEIYFKKLGERITPGGNSEAIITFTDGSSDLDYPTGLSVEEASKRTNTMNVPMLIDLNIVKQVRDILTGKRYWTKSALWYDAKGEKINGRKYVPVKIEDVQPGDMVFPFKVFISDENDSKAVLYLNLINSGLESRTFSSVFFVNDPRLRYPAITDEVWDLITKGSVAAGMTKDECRLSLGTPNDVDTGHDWNQTIDLWRYKNGTFLQFQDGLLTSFRM